ncbi:MAG TPA: DUF5615 family PIN-like protein [Chloroflexota bacterium]|nr:DUF5615 family PIN-like protein [Chloroflexota bacterium]
MRPSGRVKLLLDEMWPWEAAFQLRGRGHDAVAAAERSDLRGQLDAVVFRQAQFEEHAVVTENAIDYRQLAADEIHQGRYHHGIILSSDRGFPRHNAGTPGRLVTALEGILTSDIDWVDREYWLR